MEIEYSNESLEFDTPKGTLSFDIDEDFLFTAMGDDGDIEAPVVFIGYSVDDGPDGYESFAEDTDLTGKVAMMLRFEPMDETGNSRWGNNRWSRKAGFAAKFNAVAKAIDSWSQICSSGASCTERRPRFLWSNARTQGSKSP